MEYRADIDGLRTVAVIPVVLFHLGFNWISGGYFGVDVFFVISGFLITSILQKELATNSFSMKSFWLRRVRRILPAIITVVVTTLIIAYFFAFKGDLANIALDAFSALFSYANFHMWWNFGDYWGQSAENSFFLHSWSLSVEEQFYVFYPLLLFFLYKKKQSLSKWLILFIIFSLGAFLYGSKYYPTMTFYLLPTRAWELASGGLLAISINHRIITKIHGSLRSYLAFSGLVLILSSYFIFTDTRGVNYSAILPVLGTTIVIAFSSTNNLIGKLLSLKPVVYIGKISYSLYLWHWPVIVFFRSYYSSKFSPLEIVGITVLSTALLSILSYHLIENKTRKWSRTPRLVLFSIPIVVCFIFLLRSSFVSKVYRNDFNPTVFNGYYYNIHPKAYRETLKSDEKKVDPRREGVIAPTPDNKNKDSYRDGGIITSSIEGNPKIVVLGDSHGTMWAKTIDEIASEEHRKVSFYTANGASPFFNVEDIESQNDVRDFEKGQRILYAKDFVSKLYSWKPDLLIIVCRWNSIKVDRYSEMEDLISLCNEIGIKVLLLNQPPQINTIGDRNTAQYLTFLGYKPISGAQYIKHGSHVETTNAKLEKRFGQYSNVTVFDVYSFFIQKEDHTFSRVIEDADILYYDDDHLSYQGTSLLKRELDEVIEELISNAK